ncbi:MAG: type II toxin-antitoxin system RelE/ParE family toxin [Fimbriimonadaceae bacterium]|nr:type II toxin-antitoxin system RelE/ParE family toxin [Fimbriimonadaceae bacterium]
MHYRVELATAARRQLRDLPPTVQDRVLAALGRLVDDPRSQAAKLRGSRHGLWRSRVGRDYRLVYEVDDRLEVVTVVWIGNRRDAYR